MQYKKTQINCINFFIIITVELRAYLILLVMSLNLHDLNYSKSSNPNALPLNDTTALTTHVII